MRITASLSDFGGGGVFVDQIFKTLALFVAPLQILLLLYRLMFLRKMNLIEK